MPLFIRKIEYAKWAQNDITKGEEPSADAITHCLKTKQNTLSIWSIAGEEELEEAVLAIASQFDHLDTIDILTIKNSLIENVGLNLKNIPGETPYERFAERHWDVTDLTYSSLGKMAKAIVESIKEMNRIRFNKRKLIDIIKRGLDENKIQRKKLKPGVEKHFPV